MNPSISRLDKQREKKIKKQLVEQQFEPVQVRFASVASWVKLPNTNFLMLFWQGTSGSNPLLDGEFSDSESKGRKRTFSVRNAVFVFVSKAYNKMAFFCTEW